MVVKLGLSRHDFAFVPKQPYDKDHGHLLRIYEVLHKYPKEFCFLKFALIIDRTLYGAKYCAT